MTVTRQFLQEMLTEIKIKAGSSIFGSVGLSCVLDDEVIEANANNCQFQGKPVKVSLNL